MNVAIWYIYLDVRTEMTLSPPVSPSDVSVTNIIIPPNMHISRNQILEESSRNSITYMGRKTIADKINTAAEIAAACDPVKAITRYPKRQPTSPIIVRRQLLSPRSGQISTFYQSAVVCLEPT
jgi:hypothetical protein